MKGSGGALQETLVRIREPFETGAIRGSAPWLAAFRTLTFPTLIVGASTGSSRRRRASPFESRASGFRAASSRFCRKCFRTSGTSAAETGGSCSTRRGSRDSATSCWSMYTRPSSGPSSARGGSSCPRPCAGPAMCRGCLRVLRPRACGADIRKIDRHSYSCEEAGAEATGTSLRADGDPAPSSAVRRRCTAPFGGRRGDISARTAGCSSCVARRPASRGGCLLHTRRGVVLRRVGVRDGDERLLRDGALTALYLFPVRPVQPGGAAGGDRVRLGHDPAAAALGAGEIQGEARPRPEGAAGGADDRAPLRPGRTGCRRLRAPALLPHGRRPDRGTPVIQGHP